MQNERTLKMKQEFMLLHNKGLSVKEIAEKFNLNVTTVYASLETIAQKEGCTRESLLKRVHAPHLTYDRQFDPVPEVDVKQYTEKFDVLKKSAEELSTLMSKDISELKEAIQQ